MFNTGIKIPSPSPSGPSATPSTPAPEDRIIVRDSGTGDPRRFTSDDLPKPSGAVLGTAVGRQNGRPVFNPGPDDLVIAGGLQMTVKQAEEYGYLHRGQDGRYQEGPSADLAAGREADQKTAVEQQADTRATISEASEGNLGEVIRALDFYIGEGASRSVFSRMLADPSKTPTEIMLVAQRSGVPVGNIQEATLAATGELTDQAGDAAREEGVQRIDAFRSWVATHKGPHALARASLAQFWQGDLEPTRALARDYLAANPNDADGSIEGARKDPRGREYIDTITPSGRRMPVSARVARRLRLNIPSR